MVSGELMTPHSHTNIHYKVGISMGHITAQDFIRKEVAVWGEDYVDDLLDRGYIPVELIVNGKLKWWWRLDTDNVSRESVRNLDLTQPISCARLAPSRSVVSPVSTVLLTPAD
jgi:hypothetical protein